MHNHRMTAIQVPIGVGENFKGLVDIVRLKTYFSHGSNEYIFETYAFSIHAVTLQITQMFLIVVM